MNAVEIEEAISKLAEAPYDAESFPFDFLQAFGQSDAALRKLKSGDANKSDCGGVLQRARNNIHIKSCAPGEVAAVLAELRASPATAKQKARFILATDGNEVQAEHLTTGDVVACAYRELACDFRFFLPLAGISYSAPLAENKLDVKATTRLNKLYVELLKFNPDWDSEARRKDLNHFFARLIFCFFAEDTVIFDDQLFTRTIGQMTERNGSDVHEVLSEIFRAMNVPTKHNGVEDRRHRDAAQIKLYAKDFPYVNGELFSGSTETPKFNQSARNYLLFVGNLDWKLINPDIFGSMIQAVADDEERGALGMHYTSVPNILKVLNPLFLDDLRAKLEDAGDGKTPGSARKLLNLRNRIARIRIFDPACGSGNFLVIAYKEMRQIEAEINHRRGEVGRTSEIPISNFRGIEIRHFPAEIARLALIIAEFQCNVLHSGELFARQEFLPLDAENWITCGNALRLDWLSLWPVETTAVNLRSDVLFGAPKQQSEIDFETVAGETYLCGNPPYKGTKNQTREEKDDLQHVFRGHTRRSGTLDYVTGWFLKAALYADASRAAFAFVSTNSICQGAHVPVLWPLLYRHGLTISFAYQSFKWRNLASNNAGVTVIVVGLSVATGGTRRLFQNTNERDQIEVKCAVIGPYLIPGSTVIVEGRSTPLSALVRMDLGNAPYEGGNLIVEADQIKSLGLSREQQHRWLRPLWGSVEVIEGWPRYCLWINDKDFVEASSAPSVHCRIEGARAMRLASKDAGTRAMANRPHQFREMNCGRNSTLVVPIRSSEARQYLPVQWCTADARVTNLAYAIYDGPLWNLAIVASRMHLVWVAAVCGKLETRFSYSNKMGWHTFPIPMLTDENKAALARCAEDILLAREGHFPATIADMYDPEAMNTKYPDLRAAHDRNDETLERIYIGRRFRNDTERLEKLFEMYTQMTAKATPAAQAAKPRKAGKK